jgi:hypothetical protein
MSYRILPSCEYVIGIREGAMSIVCARNQSSALITLDGGLQTAARAAHISLVEGTP